MPQPTQNLVGVLLQNYDGTFNSLYPSGNKPAGYNPDNPPIITGYSGTFSQGSTFTITGSNLSSNRQSQLFYDDFSSGTIGSPISGGSTWQTVATQDPYVYDSDGLAAGKKSAYLDMQGAYDYITGITFPASMVIYCEHWIKYQMLTVGPDDGSGGPQMKMTRIGAGTDFSSISSNPNLTMTMLDVNASGYVGTSPQAFNAPSKSTNDAAQNISGYMLLPPDNSWHKLHMAAKISTLGVADGWRYFKTDQSNCAVGSWASGTEKHFASPNGTVAKAEWDGEAWSTRYADDGSTLGGTFEKVVLPFFTRTYQVSTVKIAGFWLNDSAERVVVSSSSDWETALMTGITQPNLTRSSGVWTFSVETGNLPASGALYAFVVNENRKHTTIALQIRA